MGFKVHKAPVLTEEELRHLVVHGTGLNVAAKLQKHGAVAEEPCKAIIMSVEQGKVQGSMWMVTGNLGSVKFSQGVTLFVASCGSRQKCGIPSSYFL